MRFTPFNIVAIISAGLMVLTTVMPAMGISRSTADVTLTWTCGIFLLLVVLGVTRIGMQFFGPAVCHGSRKATQDHPPRVALTFDDGPDPAVTPALLKLLAEHNIHATFFCIGSAVRQHPELAKQMVEQGHLIENHTDTHHWSVNFALNARWRRELQGANDAIERATGRRPRFMRPPMGLTNPHLHGVLRELNLTLAGWDVRSFDTLGKPAAQVIERVVKQARPGSVVLLHDGKQDVTRVCEIVSGVIEKLAQKRFAFVRLDEMVGS